MAISLGILTQIFRQTHMLPPWQPPQRPDATPAAKRATAGHNMRDPGYFLTASRGGAGPFQSLSEATMLSGHHLETKSKPPEPAWIPRMTDAIPMHKDTDVETCRTLLNRIEELFSKGRNTCLQIPRCPDTFKLLSCILSGVGH